MDRYSRAHGLHYCVLADNGEAWGRRRREYPRLSPRNSSLSKARRSSLSPFCSHSCDYGGGRTQRMRFGGEVICGSFPGYNGIYTVPSFHLRTICISNFYGESLRGCQVLETSLVGRLARPVSLCRCSFWAATRSFDFSSAPAKERNRLQRRLKKKKRQRKGETDTIVLREKMKTRHRDLNWTPVRLASMRKKDYASRFC